MKGSSTVADFQVWKREADRKQESVPERFCRETRLVRVNDHVVLGAQQVPVMAGPCSVESEEQILRAAKFVALQGARVIRGGVFKPRTSPYAFQGLGKEGARYLKAAADEVGLAVISEILDPRQLDTLIDCVDIFQVGARNMYNYPLLKELGRLEKPVLLKRAFSATIEELIGAAEYILSRGNQRVILCERGIRSFDSSTRFCLDLAAIPVIKSRCDLPVVIDPSHGTGVAHYVEPMSRAAVAAGADGLLIEVHSDPSQALSDGKQSLDFDQFGSLMNSLSQVANAVGRCL